MLFKIFIVKLERDQGLAGRLGEVLETDSGKQCRQRFWVCQDSKRLSCTGRNANRSRSHSWFPTKTGLDMATCGRQLIGGPKAQVDRVVGNSIQFHLNGGKSQEISQGTLQSKVKTLQCYRETPKIPQIASN